MMPVESSWNNRKQSPIAKRLKALKIILVNRNFSDEEM